MKKTSINKEEVDIALQLIVNHMLVKGMLVYFAGSLLGKPYTHLSPVAVIPLIDDFKEIFKFFGKRIASKITVLFD